jgi:hypothetical protein
MHCVSLLCIRNILLVSGNKKQDLFIFSHSISFHLALFACKNKISLPATLYRLPSTGEEAVRQLHGGHEIDFFDLAHAVDA